MREKRVNLKIPAYVRETLTALETAGHQAYCVGGCVRDTLLGRVPGDWDVTTAARPEQVLALFDGCAIPTGLKHGTVTVRAEGMGIEVTTFRADGTYTDHRRPDAVTFSRRLEDDLSRRDLTVNAMAMDRRGQITDLFGGREDLKAGVLRCVGDPERRFREDALRILRTLRFAAVLGFAIEPRTAAALHETAPLLKYIAPERILSEMDRALCGGHILPVLLDCGMDILNPIQPECMNPAEIYRAYHDRVVLWGTIGTQTTMPFGTPDDVRTKAREMLELAKKEGRLILAPTHLLEPEVPLENLDALTETVRNFSCR